MRSMRVLVVALLILAAAAPVACSDATKDMTTSAAHGAAASAAPSATPATLTPPAALGVELRASQIPWNEVGSGWILATWSPAPGLRPGQVPPPGQPAVAPATLYLVDPAGGRYAITTLPLMPPAGPGDLGHTPALVDWSGDGRRALFEDYGADPNSPGRTTMTEVDLATGAKHSFTIGTGGVSGAYTRPTGQAILLSTFLSPQQGWTLERVDRSGTKQLTFPIDVLGPAGTYNGAYLQRADGAQLALGTAKGLILMGNDGVVGRQLPIPGTLTDCRPVRWWTAGVILTHCDPGTLSSASQLWRVPLSGGPPSALTAVNTGREESGFGEDLDDTDAWQLPGGTFLQSEAGCGAGFLSRLTPDRHTTPVTIPGAADSGHVSVAGATGDDLVLRTKMGCGSGISVLTYDPAASTTTVLLGPPVNGGGVQNAILYPPT
ncbi:MAG: hypothetical protein JWM76_915 [Pseudonocardiales bacterium]|nr:hypothetical protein [Pseudonocardiales bacterium]